MAAIADLADAPKLAHRSIWPGLLLSAGIAAAAVGLNRLPGMGLVSPLILSILIGMAVHNIWGTPAAALPGVKVSLRRVLRAGIVLLGLQLTFAQVIAVGPVGVAVIVSVLLATFVFTKWLGAQLGLDPRLTELIAAGSSICGASAVIACNTVTRGRDEDVAYAIACVTIFGSLSMVLMPIVAPLLPLSPEGYGFWTGASIHEVAQVVAAAFQGGDAAGEVGTIAKLTRVMMLAPLVLTLGVLATRRGTTAQGRAPVPWFVLGFVAMVGLASTGWLPGPLVQAVAPITSFLLAMALAAMGLETDLRRLLAEGLRPAALGAASWVFISVLSLVLILVTGLGGMS